MAAIVMAYPRQQADILDSDDMDRLVVEAALENMDVLLGSSGANLSTKLSWPFYTDAE